MKRRDPVPDHIREQHEQELYRFYYEYEDQLRIEQYSQYHFRIFATNKNTVDVWPARKVYYGRGMHRSENYEHTDELKTFLKLK